MTLRVRENSYGNQKGNEEGSEEIQHQKVSDQENSKQENRKQEERDKKGCNKKECQQKNIREEEQLRPQVRKGIGQERRARDEGHEEGHAEEWPQRQEGHKPEAGHRNRLVRSTQVRREGSKEEELALNPSRSRRYFLSPEAAGAGAAAAGAAVVAGADAGFAPPSELGAVLFVPSLEEDFGLALP
jgi:hypothetical protein